jgi:hypothetical protein
MPRFNDRRVKAGTGYRISVAGLLAILMLILSGCEILTIHATGGNQGVEGAAVGMKF